MSIQLFFSNRLEALADHLGEQLREEGRRGDPFAAGTVIVPNPNVKTWLQLHLARREKVAANLRFPFLERGLWECLTELAGERQGQLQPLSRELLQAMILGVITSRPEALPAADELGPLIAYLRQPNGDERPNYARRAWQLAGRLAALFVEYGFQREDMIRDWRQGRLSKEGRKAPAEESAMERCQMRLYQLLLGPGGWRDRRDRALGVKTLTLPECADLVLAAEPEASTARRPLHLFGLSNISPFHRDLLLRLAPWRSCALYQFNVCAEYWEDVTTPAEDRWWSDVVSTKVTMTEAGQELDRAAPENPLLKAWGKPGRESLKMLSDLEARAESVVAFEEDWVGGTLPDRSTVLGLVQEQVLTRSSQPAGAELRQDTSLQVLGCPGIFREVETVHASIVENLQRTPDLRLTDIAVMVPDMATYQPVIQAVFDREPRLVPYNLGDSTAADESVYGKAVMALLEVAAGKTTRKAVFELVLNPCFLTAVGMGRDEALVWLKWADELSVYRGIDREDKLARQYLDSPLYTWQHAFQRLRLGRLMRASCAPDPAAESWNELVPYGDMESQDPTQLGRFCGCLETLFARLRPLGRLTASGESWRGLLLGLFDGYLAPPPDRPAEAQVRQRLGEQLLSLSALDELAKAMGEDTPLFGAQAASVNLELVTEAVREALAAIPSRHGAYLSGGVNISSLRPMRPIPFRITYIMGLGEGSFPGYPDYSSLDLRARQRRVGDITKPEENQYLFLEALMSVSDKLYLTYVNQELAKEEPLHPCTVVNQLMGCVNRSLPGGEFVTGRVPLTGNSLGYLEPGPAGIDGIVNHGEGDRLLALAELARRGQDVPGLAAALARASLPELVAREPEPWPERVKMKLRDLSRFLENPLEAGFRYRLGLFQDDVDERMLAEHEPFALDARDNSMIVRRTLEAILRRAQSEPGLEQVVAEEVESHYGDLRRRGKAPDGPYAELDREHFERQVASRVIGDPKSKVKQTLAELLADLTGGRGYELVTIGEPADTKQPSLALPAIELPVTVGGQPVTIELQGTLALCWRLPPQERLEMIVVGGSKASGGYPVRQILPAFVTCLGLKAGAAGHRDFVGDEPFTIHFAHRDGYVSYRFGCTADEANGLLAELAGGLLSGDAFDMLPFDVLRSAKLLPLKPEDAPEAPVPEEFAAEVAQGCRGELDAFQAAWRPTDLARLCVERVPADALAKARRRFDLLTREAGQ